MVNFGYPWLPMLKPKKVITRRSIVRFQWFRSQNGQNFPAILCQRSNNHNSFINDELWRFLSFVNDFYWCVDFLSFVNDIFPRSFFRKSFASKQAGAPTSGGIIWYHMIPFGTNMVPYWYHIGTRFVPDCSQLWSPGKRIRWHSLETKFVPDSGQIGTRFVPYWYQIRARFVPN